MRSAHIEVREKSNGEITIEYKQRRLEYTIYSEQEQQQAKVVEAKARCRAHIPGSAFTLARTRSKRASAAVNSVACASR